MRSTVVAITTIICTLIAILCVLTYNSYVIKQNEVYTSISTAFPQTITLSKNASESDTKQDKHLESYLLQNIILQNTSDCDLVIKVVNVNAEHGLVDAEVTGVYKWFGTEKSVTVRKTVILEGYHGTAEKAEYEVKFISDGEVFRLVKGSAGSKLENPGEPDLAQIHQGSFIGWREFDGTNYSEIITDAQWSKMVIYRNTTYVATYTSDILKATTAEFGNDMLNATLTIEDLVREGEILGDSTKEYLAELYEKETGILPEEITMLAIDYPKSNSGAPFINHANYYDVLGIYTYRDHLEKEETVTITLRAGVTEKKGDGTIITDFKIKVKNNEYARMEVSDRYISLDEIKNGIDVEEKLTSTVSVKDDKFSNISNRTKILGYTASSYQEPGVYTLTYSVLDDSKYRTSKTAILNVVAMNEKPVIVETRYPRSINEYYYPLLNDNLKVDSEGNYFAGVDANGLLCYLGKDGNILTDPEGNSYLVDAGPAVRIKYNPDNTAIITPISKWFKTNECSELLKKSLSNGAYGTPLKAVRTWSFTNTEVKEIQANVINKGIDLNFVDKYEDLNAK